MKAQRQSAVHIVGRFIILLWGCGAVGVLCGSGCSTQPTTSGDDTNNTQLPSLDPVPLMSKGAPAFGVVLTADRASGVPGTVFAVTAHIAPNVTVGSISWSINGTIDPSNQAVSATFSFLSSGDETVTATVTDNQGRQVSDGILLKVFDPSATPANRTAKITPAAGMPGTIVHIESNALNVAAVQILIKVGDTDPIEPFRPELGAATFIVPLNAADNITQTTPIIIHVLADGQEVAQFGFQLSPLPAQAGAPGELIRSWFQNAPQLIDHAQSDLDDVLTGLNYDLTPEESAFLQSILRFSKSRFEQVRDTLLPLLDQLDPQSLAILDQALIANGLSAELLQSAGATAKTLRNNKNADDQLLDLIFQFHDVINALRTLVAGANSGAALLATLSAGTGTALILNGALLGTAGLMAELAVVVDMLTVIDGLVPHVLDALEVKITPNRLKEVTDPGVIEIVARLDSDPLICTESSNFFETLSARAALRIINTFALPRLAALAGITDPFFAPNADPIAAQAAITAIFNYLRDSINQIAMLVINADRVDQLLENLRPKLCNRPNARELHIQPEESIIKLNPGNGGSLRNPTDMTIEFVCQQQKGTIVINVEREAGLSGVRHLLTGRTTVTCFNESCTEDALASLTFTPMRRQLLQGTSPCTIVKPTLDTNTVEVQVTNNHPFRTIAIAAMVLYESDKRGMLPTFCSDPPAGETVQSCIDGVTDGCNTPPGLFLKPGQTSTFGILYNCLVEKIYPGNGSCGDQTLETTRGHALAQAVYCDDFQTAQDNFCSVVDPQLVQLGLPWPGLSSTTVSDCP